MRAFRRVLARRLLQIAALAGPVVAGCDRSDDCGADIGGPVHVCIVPETGDGGVADTCPTFDQELDTLREVATEVRGPGQIEQVGSTTRQGDQCCYEVQVTKDCTGRPYLTGAGALTARVRRHGCGWVAALRPRLKGLAPDVRAQLAAAWARDGLFEHASVASFGRVALELMAAGAPAALVQATHAAALDEIRHARQCFALAEAYGGAPVGPDTFPFDGHVRVSADLVSIAVRAAAEGCVGETVAAVQADEQAARATDPVVRRVLTRIAADEAKHAELAWRTVLWAVYEGGPRVRVAVGRVFAALEIEPETAPRTGALDAHGRLEPEESARLAARTRAEIVMPAARALAA
jgi:hypothetical protein